MLDRSNAATVRATLLGEEWAIVGVSVPYAALHKRAENRDPFFNSMDYQPQVIKKVFSFTVTELRKNDAITTEMISELLPKLYDGLVKGQLRIKISSVVTLALEIGEEEVKKDSFDEFGDDVWR